MSVSGLKHRRFVLALGFVAAATIAACDTSPTAPNGSLTRVGGKSLAIEGDTLQCAYGWVVISGHYVCNEER